VAKADRRTETRRFAQRFLVPAFVTSLYYLLRFGARVSHRAEVELSRTVTFGRGCTVGSFTKIKATEGRLTVGADSGFATGCFVSAGPGGIEIGSHFVCGPNVSIVGRNYDYSRLDAPLAEQGATSKGIRIGDNVWIGAGVTILDGAVVGDNTIVVANSLVNRRYPANAILQGAPAKVILDRSRTPGDD